MADLIQQNQELVVAEEVEKAIKITHIEISNTPTPSNQVDTRPDGFKYVKEHYLRRKLTENFPVWSWSSTHSPILMGAEWVIVSGTLRIWDNGVWREFSSYGAARIQFKKNQEHMPENVVDIDKNIASANTNAFKRAVNRLCNIADDVYKKIIEENITIEQAKKLLKLAKSVGKEETIEEMIENGEINSVNYAGSLAKLERLTKK